MKRRTFVKTSCALTAGSLVACASPLVHVTAEQQGDRLIVTKDVFADRSLVTVAAEPFPVGIAKVSDDKYIASRMECTHQSCQTALAENGFVCPCHGSRFAADGAVQKGPALRDLARMSVVVEDTQISVFIS